MLKKPNVAHELLKFASGSLKMLEISTVVATATEVTLCSFMKNSMATFWNWYSTLITLENFGDEV